MSRRDFLRVTAQSAVASSVMPAGSLVGNLVPKSAIRCINVVNFIREIEPRFPMDMMLPVQKQMEIIKSHRLPATWLLQFDALVSGPFVPFLKANMAKNHEVGFWFEMNEKHCKAAGVEWRGRPGYEWDHYPFVAFTIGYTPEERIKLADTAMKEFRRIWGYYPRSVASWNLDAITMAHLSEKYGVDAFAVCRDQVATDGFTIWGAPIAGYYPSKVNMWSAALDRRNQINTPVFRMLGQDPVYYYNLSYPVPDGRRIGEPDTMEPVWTSGRSEVFVDRFLKMISDAPTMQFGYAQLGQENTFPWDRQEAGYPLQMKALAELSKKGLVHVETMGDSGRRFKKAFKQTPAQAQVQLLDSFGNSNEEKSIWYQSRFYRANLHIQGDQFFLRDITIYSDEFQQPFLNKATRDYDVEQRMPAILDGHHWKKDGKAGGFFLVDGKPVKLAGAPVVTEEGSSLLVTLPTSLGKALRIRFEERQIVFADQAALEIAFEWDTSKAAKVEVQPDKVRYDWHGFAYGLEVKGSAKETSQGWSIQSSNGEIRLQF